MTTTTSPQHLTFEAPGPGEWMLDTTHHGRRPLTRFLAPMMLDVFERGMAGMLERYGLPLQTVQGRLVNGCFYVRPKPVGEGDKARPAPPAFVLKLVARLHPELRRRNRTAAAAWAEKRWRADVDHWFDVERGPTIARLIELQTVELRDLDDHELLEHLDELVAYAVELMHLGFTSHGGDIIPTGDYFAHCEAWGIDTSRAASLLTGASPATSESARVLAPVREALAHADQHPGSVEEVRGLGTRAAEAVDRWFELFAWRLIDSDDLDGTTMAEQPELQLPAILASASAEAIDDAPDPSAVRAQVPADQRSMFDELLAEARYGLRLRDDNVGVRWNWPGGLMRRTLLEIGRRLVEEGRLADPSHGFELDHAEVGPLLLDGHGPSADDVAERRAFADRVEAAGAPDRLGEPEGEPPFDAFPAPIARAARSVMAMIAAMEGTGERPELRGVGVGDTPVRGTARVVDGVDDAFAHLAEGDILVAPFTGPAYNTILAMVGGVVVEEGGPLCHAAIVARELGIPAVVGVRGATDDIPDGAKIELDPAGGAIRIL